MTILILDDSPQEIAQSLDDRSLSKMIKSVAQVLCNVHHERIGLKVECKCYGCYLAEKHIRRIPLEYKKGYQQWATWASHCIANYRYLVGLGCALCDEFNFRNECGYCGKGYNAKPPCKNLNRPMLCDKPKHKLQHVIEWCRDNEPDLPRYFNPKIQDNEDSDLSLGHITPIPLVMPKKFKEEVCVGEACQQIDAIFAYRNYYKHILDTRRTKSHPCDTEKEKWTRRSKPIWIEDRKMQDLDFYNFNY